MGLISRYIKLIIIIIIYIGTRLLGPMPLYARLSLGRTLCFARMLFATCSQLVLLSSADNYHSNDIGFVHVCSGA